MGMIPREVVDAVRDRTDIAEIISRHVALSRRGGNLVGLCPFHQERSPSFNVIPAKGIFHCFGCQVGGDVFKFLMMLQGLSFVEAVQELAGPAGVTIEQRELTDAERKSLKRRATLYDLLEEAAAWYEGQLWTSREGQIARDYLDGRGLGAETAKAARLGYAPDGWTRLGDHLQRQGFEPQRILEAGLARERRGGGGSYDLFRERLLIPIRDDRSRVIGFGGRLLADEKGDDGHPKPKYINSPETRLYEKSKVLYGLDQARRGIGQRDRVLVVEGYFDVLSLHQAGFPETVATCGTALTPEHLQKIRRLTANVMLVMDADEAGQRAAERTLPLFLDAGLQPWRLELPGAKDPDELVRQEGPGALERAIEKREPMVEWLVFDRKLTAYSRSTSAGPDHDAMSRERVIEELTPLLARVPHELVSRVAVRLGMPEVSLHKRLADASRGQPASGDSDLPPPEPSGWRPHRNMVHLLWLLVHRYAQVADLVMQADPHLMDGQGAAVAAVARLVSGEPVAAVLEDTVDPGVARTLSAVVARDRLYTEEEAQLAVCQVLEKLGQPLRSARKALLADEMNAALQKGEMERYRTAAEARSRLGDLEKQLQRALATKDLTTVVRLLPGTAGSVA